MPPAGGAAESDEGPRTMQYAVRYQLKLSEVENDGRKLAQVYADLAHARPDWLRCQSLRMEDQTTSVLLVDVDDMGRLSELPSLSSYLETLAERCDHGPQAGPVDPSIDVTGAVELGLWDPDRTPATSRS